jgi:hypothetical protein
MTTELFDLVFSWRLALAGPVIMFLGMLNSWSGFFNLKQRAFEAYCGSKALSGPALLLEQVQFASWFSAVSLSGQIAVPPSPAKLVILAEGLVTSGDRSLGNEELELGDPEFDSRCWVVGEQKDLEEIEAYLTSDRRKALSYAALALPSFSLKDNVISFQKHYFLPFYGRRNYSSYYDSLETISGAFRGETSANLTTLLHKANKKFTVSLAIKTSLLSLVPLVSAPLYYNPMIAKVVVMVSSLGLLFSGFSLTGSLLGRVLLQSYFALQASLCVVLPLWAHLAGSLETYEMHANLLVINLLCGVLFWSARHYLMTVGVSKSRSKKPAEASLDL